MIYTFDREKTEFTYRVILLVTMFFEALIILLSSSVVNLSIAKNIVLIIADDLDLVLDGMTPMTNTLNLIGNEGATYSNYFVASPICCPNRASILTGKYQHNHLTVNNSISGGCNSPQWQQQHEPLTFAALLKDQMDYITFYAGKYLNQYGDERVGGVEHVPPGWDWWAGLVGNSKYYNYSLSMNGTRKKYGDKTEDYLTDVIGELSREFFKGYTSSDPFLMVLAPPAPHAPFTPAARHVDKYKDVKAKRTPNFNTAWQTKKHWLVGHWPSPLPTDALPQLDEIYRRRWESLLAVDDLVTNVYNTLKEKRLLNETYIIFTSDNGYHIGQFAMPLDKRQPYETDIRVPFLIRGPGITYSEVSTPISSVDLFATILDIAGVKHSSDGTSILKDDLAEDRVLLIEYRGERSVSEPTTGCPSDSDLNLTHCHKEFACRCEDSANNTFSCIRRVSPRYNNIFCLFEDGEAYMEAYDLAKDAYQMDNIAFAMKRNRRRRFKRRLREMVNCRDVECIVAN